MSASMRLAALLTSLVLLPYVLCCMGNGGAAAAAAANASPSLSRPVLTMSNAWKIPVDTTTCSDLRLLQIKRAIGDVDRLVSLGVATLLHNPSAPIVQRYFGDAKQHEADLTAPIGLLTRLQHGNKEKIMLKCEESSSSQSKNSTCVINKEATTEGGFVVTERDSTTITLCAHDFSAGTSTASTAREYLEDICQDDWTLNSNSPTTFWAASLLSLFMRVPQLSAPKLHAAQHAYANVLETARREPHQAKNNIYSYLYLLLDLFARKHHKGGCSGHPSGRVHEES